MVKVLNRDKIQRMVDYTSGAGTQSSSGSGGDGVSQAWVNANFVSIAYFEQLFKAYKPAEQTGDPDVEVKANTIDEDITNIKAMKGFWTEQFISALGQGSGGGGGGGASALTDLVDVSISSPSSGQVLMYDGNGHWINGSISMSGYATQAWVQQQGYLPATSAAETYLSKTDAASTYLSKTDAASTYLSKTDAQTTYLSKTDAASTYLSIAFFSRLFQAYNGSTAVNPNDTTSTIDNIKAMFGFWTEQYISALGQNSGGGGGIVLAEPLQSINSAGLGMPQSANVGLVWNGSSWTYGTIGTGSGTVTSVKVGTTSYSPVNGVVSLPAYPTVPTNVSAFTNDSGYITSSGSCAYATNCDMVDGYHSSSFLIKGGTYGMAYYDLNSIPKNLTQTGGFGWTEYETHPNAGGGFVTFFLGSSLRTLLMVFPSYNLNQEPVLYSSIDDGAWGNEKRLAYTTSNVASATKLQTARTIWGQSFDGTLNVSGDMTGVGDITSAKYKIINHPLGVDSGFVIAKPDGTYRGEIAYYVDHFYIANYDATAETGISFYNNGNTVIFGNGNVGIGTTSPSYKLDVNGDVRATNFRGNLVGNADSATKLQTPRTIWGQSFDGAGNVSGIMTFSTLAMATNYTDTWSDGTNSHPWYGYDHRYGDIGVFSTTISDYNGLTLRTGSGFISMTVDGNVGIGTTSPSYKLSVSGDVSATNFRGALVGNASSATQLQTSRTIWGQSFDGSGNVTGNLTLGANNYLFLTGSSYSNGSYIIGRSGGIAIAVGGSSNEKFAFYSSKFYANAEIEAETGVYSHGYVTALSDVRLKNIIDRFTLKPEAIALASLIHYTWKDGHDKNRVYVGGIAQEWQEILPEAVHDIDGRLTMDYGVIGMVSAVSLAKTVIEQEKRIKSLEERLAAIEAKIK